MKIFFFFLAVNIDGKIGAVGFVSVLFPSVYPVALLKVDEETREIIRDSNGLCIRCKPGKLAKELIGNYITSKYLVHHKL